MARHPARTLRLLIPALAALLAVPAACGEGPDGQKPPGAEEKSPYEKFLEKGAIKDFPERDWSQAFSRDSICYRVKTTTSMDVAEYVGVLMDAVHLHYCHRFGVHGTRKANINIFRTHKEMAAWAKKNCRFNVKSSVIGFYTSWGGGTLCVVWKKLYNQRPETVLMHEGTHQFVAATWGRAIPIWLNEGFAVYFENSKFDGRNLDVGRVPAARLRRLQQQMRNDKHVKLEKLFATDRKAFTVDCYGSAWAYVYWLAHSADTDHKRRIHQMALGRYVADCRRNRQDGKNLVAYMGRTMEQMEKEWKEWVLKLDPSDPYGGTRKEAEAKAPAK
ncbi:MAG: DUF1570 domain-containing protein [Planctomycetota bacterium]|jgi:hypothetical protein